MMSSQVIRELDRLSPLWREFYNTVQDAAEAILIFKEPTPKEESWQKLSRNAITSS